MQNIRSVDTAPELAISRELRKRKIYFSRNVKSIIGKPDFVFRRKKVAVFVDSDFWHGHPVRGHLPKSNLGYWQEKIGRNKRRDAAVNKELRAKGWHVLRIWEHSIKKHYSRSVNRILKAIGDVGID